MTKVRECCGETSSGDWYFVSFSEYGTIHASWTNDYTIVRHLCAGVWPENVFVSTHASENSCQRFYDENFSDCELFEMNKAA